MSRQSLHSSLHRLTLRQNELRKRKARNNATNPNGEGIQTNFGHKIASALESPRELSRYSGGLWTGRPGFDSWQKQEIFSTPHRHERLWGPLSLLSKWKQECEADHLPSSNAVEYVELYLKFSTRLV
jgi:hypothetical protein